MRRARRVRDEGGAGKGPRSGGPPLVGPGQQSRGTAVGVPVEAHQTVFLASAPSNQQTTPGWSRMSPLDLFLITLTSSTTSTIKILSSILPMESRSSLSEMQSSWDLMGWTSLSMIMTRLKIIALRETRRPLDQSASSQVPV